MSKKATSKSAATAAKSDTATRKSSTKKRSINMKPPKGVQTACKRGLELKDDYGGKGLVAPTIRWASALAEGQPITAQKVRKMRAWFARHKVDRRKGWSNPPTPGYVAWLLWGGDAGQRWSQKLVRSLEAQA